ncbi:MAG: chemotaxis-specific protein-glutamate methyltransferase CheB [Myxococcales bacterium]
MTADRRIRVLIVEDSPSARKLLEDLLAGAPELELVGQARDGQEALRLAIDLQPEVVLLDLEMPRMDGFTFLRFFRTQSRRPVLVLSRHSGRGDVRRALDLGATAFLPKPPLGAGPGSPEAQALLDQIRALGPGAEGRRAEADVPPARAVRVALLGASTGGPTAVQQILAALPADLPLGVVVAQHMPARFTPAFAERLNRASAFSVREARGGEPLAAGSCLVAPGGKSIEVVLEAGRAAVGLQPRGAADRYVPSVDRLFGSAAAVLGSRALGVVLTGMGDDGREGLRALRRAGARTIAEAQATAVVFGMPKAAIEAGGAQRILPLPEIVQAIVDYGRNG